MWETRQEGLKSRGQEADLDSEGSMDTAYIRKEDRVRASCKLVDRVDIGKLREFLFGSVFSVKYEMKSLAESEGRRQSRCTKRRCEVFLLESERLGWKY